MELAYLCRIGSTARILRGKCLPGSEEEFLPEL